MAQASGIVATQGVLYGIGASELSLSTLLYWLILSHAILPYNRLSVRALLYPFMEELITSYRFEWFQARQGLSAGILFSGTGAGGLIMPFISSALLDQFGQRTALLSIVSHAGRVHLLEPFA